MHGVDLIPLKAFGAKVEDFKIGDRCALDPIAPVRKYSNWLVLCSLCISARDASIVAEEIQSIVRNFRLPESPNKVDFQNILPCMYVKVSRRTQISTLKQ